MFACDLIFSVLLLSLPILFKLLPTQMVNNPFFLFLMKIKNSFNLLLADDEGVRGLVMFVSFVYHLNSPPYSTSVVSSRLFLNTYEASLANNLISIPES